MHISATKTNKMCILVEYFVCVFNSISSDTQVLTAARSEIVRGPRIGSLTMRAQSQRRDQCGTSPRNASVEAHTGYKRSIKHTARSPTVR